MIPAAHSRRVRKHASPVAARLEKLAIKLATLVDLQATRIECQGRELSDINVLLRHLLDDRRPDGKEREALKMILSTARMVCQFDCGAVYFADELYQEFICLAEIGFEPQFISLPNYKFSETSFIRKIYLTGKPQFSPNPLSDPSVHPRGRTYFEFKTGLIGVPLTIDRRVLGILVAWGSRPPDLLLQTWSAFSHLANSPPPISCYQCASNR